MNALILFFLYLSVRIADCSNGNGDTKYIDLLPEAEKQQFLDKIARRILSEIQSTHVSNQSVVEVSDQQLNAHQEYVKKILQEETDNLRIMKMNLTGLRAATDGIHNNEDISKQYQDLTLRQRMRRNGSDVINVKNNTNASENFPIPIVFDNTSHSHIKTAATTESVNKENTKIFQSDNYLLNENDNHTMSQTTENYNKILNIKSEALGTLITKKPPISRNTDLQNIKQDEVTTQHVFDSTTELYTNKDGNNSNKNVILNYSFNSDNTTKVYTTKSPVKMASTTETVNKDYVEIIQSDKHVVLKKNENQNMMSQTVANVTKVESLVSTKKVLTSSNTKSLDIEQDEVTTQKVFESTIEFYIPNKDMSSTPEVIYHYSNNGNNITEVSYPEKSKAKTIFTTISPTSEINDLKPQGTEPKSKQRLQNKMINSERTTQTSVDLNSSLNSIKVKSQFMSQNIEKTTNVKKNAASNSNTLATQIESITNVIYTSNNVTETKVVNTNDNKESKEGNLINIITLRPHNSEEDLQIRSAQWLQNVTEPSVTKAKTYNVFEIRVDETPFIPKSNIKEKVQKEEPLYVPVYNYAPSNAYFNSYNRLGPNYEDDKGLRSYDKYYDDDYKSNSNSEYRKFSFGISNTKKPQDRKKGQNKSALLKLLQITQTPTTHRSIYFNPNDYLDVNYYFGRSGKKKGNDFQKEEGEEEQKEEDENKSTGQHKKQTDFENTKANINIYGNLVKGDTEETEKNDHMTKKMKVGYEKHFNITSNNKYKEDQEQHNEDVYDSKEFSLDMSNSKKTYIKRIRHFLYENQDFDYIPESNKKKMTSITHNFMRSYKRYDNKATDDIDYNENTHEVSVNFKTMNIDESVSTDINNKYPYIANKKHKNHKYPKFLFKPKRIPIKVVLEYQMVPKSNNEIISVNDLLKNISPEFNDISNLPNHEKRPILMHLLSNGLDHNKVHNINTLYNRGVFDSETKRLKREKYNFANYISALSNVLSDMIESNNEGLKKYDWLGTTVDLQAALDKLINLIHYHRLGEEISYEDLQLIEYIEYLFNIIKNNLNNKGETEDENILRLSAKQILMPRNKKRCGKIKNPLKLLDRARNQMLRFTTPAIKKRISRHDDFLEFLNDLTNSLSDLHDAIKHISMITPYTKQKWYKNLKELYIGNPTEKVVLEVLLHIIATRFFDLIEESANNSLQEDYISYIQNNNKQVKKTKDEFKTIILLVEQMKH